MLLFFIISIVLNTISLANASSLAGATGADLTSNEICYIQLYSRTSVSDDGIRGYYITNNDGVSVNIAYWVTVEGMGPDRTLVAVENAHEIISEIKTMHPDGSKGEYIPEQDYCKYLENLSAYIHDEDDTHKDFMEEFMRVQGVTRLERKKRL